MGFAIMLILFVYVGLCSGQGRLLKEKERRSLDYTGYYYDTPEEPSSPGPELDRNDCARNCKMTYAPPDEFVADPRIELLLVGNGVNIHNYRTSFNDQEGNLIDLGEIKSIQHYDWEDSERIVHETSLAQGTFVFDTTGEIVVGVFEHAWIPDKKVINENGEEAFVKLWVKSEVHKDYVGRLVRSISPIDDLMPTKTSGDARSDVLHYSGNLQTEESEEEIVEDAMVSAWMGGLSTSGRRKLWLQSLKKRPSRRRLGRQLEENGEDHVEIHVAFHYTADALFWNWGMLQMMKDRAFMSIAEGNIALQNSGVHDLAFIMHQEFISVDIEAHGGDWEQWGTSLSKSDRSIADINILIMSRSEMADGAVGQAYAIPIINKGTGYEHAKAFARISEKVLGGLTLIHELGHLLGLGHNAGTVDCKPGKFSQCAHVIKCGDGGIRTVMAYDTNTAIRKKLKNEGGRHFACAKKDIGAERRVKHFSNPAIDYEYDGINYGATGKGKANAVAQIFIAMDHVPYYVSPNIDCEGTWSPCTPYCDRLFTQTMLKRGNGRDCPLEPPCAPGMDECPLAHQDCVGHWSPCTAQCEVGADREFTITKFPGDKGIQCPETGPDCLPGEDLCPLSFYVAKLGPISYRDPYHQCSAAGGCTTRLEDPEHFHLAICCSENWNANWNRRTWRRYPGCDVFAPISGTCESMTWEEASQHCARQGTRLCSADELEANCAMSACGKSGANKLAWSMSKVIAEKPQPPILKESLQVVGTNPEYCWATGDPHYRAPWPQSRRLLNKFDDDTIGEVDLFRIKGLRIVVVQDKGSYNRKATVHAVKIEYDHVIATISVSKLDIPEPMVYSAFTRSHWPSFPLWRHMKYQITFPDLPEVVFAWNHWISSPWGAQLGVAVRYSGSWALVGGQCGDPDHDDAMDCEDCHFGHPKEMNMNPPTCEKLQTCCSFFDDDDFTKAACLIDHFELCCEDDSDETCCDDMKP